MKLFEAVDRCTIKVKEAKTFYAHISIYTLFNWKEQLMLIFCTFFLKRKTFLLLIWNGLLKKKRKRICALCNELIFSPKVCFSWEVVSKYLLHAHPPTIIIHITLYSRHYQERNRSQILGKFVILQRMVVISVFA